MVESSPVILLKVPQASKEYDPDTFNNIVRIVQDNFDTLSGIGLLRGNGLFLDGVPTSPTGLRVGEVYIDTGFLKIVE